ncbi:MAG: DUF4143 domain-containing protein [Bdellovibrionota bacterium]
MLEYIAQLDQKGPLDTAELIDGAALETLLFQQIRALNEYYDFGYNLYHWKTRSQEEVDFVLYGEKGLIAIEVNRTASPRKKN